MTETKREHSAPISSAGRRRRKRRIVVAVLLVAVSLILLVYGLLSPGDNSANEDQCGDGVTRQYDECVGITDGSYVFDPELKAVEEKIKTENDSVVQEDHVTVAYLGSLTATPNVSIERIRSQLEGAYVAQHTVNSSGIYPKIRLVIANKGSQEKSWQPVAEQLIDMTGAPGHLVAVVGLGVSSTPTAEGAKILSRAGIPMVGAVITADGLNTTAEGLDGPIDGLTKVIPNVGHLIAVVAEYLITNRPDLRTAMLVSDRNPDDLYTSTLKRDFIEKELSPYWLDGGRVIQPYDATPGTPGVEAQFRIIASNFCGVDAPDMVFYAGRAALLPNFITQLRDRDCARTRTVTVVSGFDAAGLRSTLPPPGEYDAPVSVIYAGPDPLAMDDPQLNPDFPQYRTFADTFTRDNGFPPEDLLDGWAVMTHDAMLAATTAIERSILQDRRLPTPEEVRSLLYLANSPTSSVRGAAGTFTFDSTTGDVTGRRLPVMELQPDGSFIVRGIFDQPASS